MTKTSQTVSKLKTASMNAMVRATKSLTTVGYYEELATAELYRRIAKMV
jgi:hypothetical protein